MFLGVCVSVCIPIHVSVRLHVGTYTHTEKILHYIKFCVENSAESPTVLKKLKCWSLTSKQVPSYDVMEAL